jgi:hypothetical protein
MTAAVDPDTADAVRLARQVIGTRSPVLAAGAPDRRAYTVADLAVAVGDVRTFRAAVHSLLHPLVCTLATRRALIAVHLPLIPLALSAGRAPHRAWWPDAGVLDVINAHEAYAYLVDLAVDALTDLVAAVAGRAGFRERELWGEVVAVFTDVGPRHTMACPDASARECETFAHAALGTVLGRRLRYLNFDHEGGVRRLVQRPTCCRGPGIGTLPSRPGEQLGRGCCVDCPRLPRSQAIRLARQELAAIDLARAGA